MCSYIVMSTCKNYYWFYVILQGAVLLEMFVSEIKKKTSFPCLVVSVPLIKW